MIRESWKQKRDAIIRRLAGEGKTEAEIACRMQLHLHVVRSALCPKPPPAAVKERDGLADVPPVSPYFDKKGLTELGRAEMLRRFDAGDDVACLAQEFRFPSERAARGAVNWYRGELRRRNKAPDISADSASEVTPSGSARVEYDVGIIPASGQLCAWPENFCFEDHPKALRKIGGFMPAKQLAHTAGGVARYG